ncbi:hypothetical protein FRB95_011929 [Tulasnella sp. JGI-2019a]|nr:hypothetical protein FRB95_011929 [Tulasnella sp. JGI-2019a]
MSSVDPTSPSPPMDSVIMDSTGAAFNATGSTLLEAAQKSAPWLIGWISIFLPMLNSPYVQESLRFFFLGTVLETGRRIFQWTLDRFTSGFFVTAHFNQGDWAYDWLNEFLAAQEIWTNSREYRVTASNLEREWNNMPGAFSNTYAARADKAEVDKDGNPRPLYFPASDMPQVIWWHRHWVQVTRRVGEVSLNGESNGSLSITIYTRKKKVLDDLVEEARLHYIKTAKPPLAAQSKKNNLTIRAVFEQADYTYSWLLDFLNKNNAWKNANEVIVTAKSSQQKWGMDLGGQDRDEKLRAYYQPCSSAPHLWNWKGTWIQVLRTPGSKDYRTGKEEGASLTLTLFTGRKETLDELVAAAAARYWDTSSRLVTVHMCESYGDWGAIITKQIRPMDSVILPQGMTDLILDDLREFMSNKDWYAAAGIPWRRGVLLWGPPGTGKSTTVHAMAGELQLEIYCVPISNSSLDDSSLQRLVSSTPPNCILLLEDIDCAFASRDDEEDEEEALNGKAFDPYRLGQAKSSVTLSGLLNLLDSVSSEEGRIVFATTNHVDRLDSALLRPGRMDLRVEYKNATKGQAADLFTRFYSQELMIKSVEAAAAVTQQREDAASAAAEASAAASTTVAHKPKVISKEAAELIKRADNSSFVTTVPTVEEIATLATEFSEKIPEHKYSIAQLQGYLLCSKRDPRGAVTLLDEWLQIREKEDADKEERLAKRKVERQKWLKVEKFRQEKERKMELEAEKELAAEAEAEEAKKAAEAAVEAAAAEGKPADAEGEKKPDGETVTTDATEAAGVKPDGASEGSETPVMVETPAS